MQGFDFLFIYLFIYFYWSFLDDCRLIFAHNNFLTENSGWDNLMEKAAFDSRYNQLAFMEILSWKKVWIFGVEVSNYGLASMVTTSY